MNATEAQYLTGAFGGLERSLLQNRMLQQQDEESIRRQLLERAMMDQRGRLAGQELTQRQGQFDAAQKQRRQEFGQTMGLQRDELDARKADQSDARTNRAAVLDLEKSRAEKDSAYQGRMESKQDDLLKSQQSQAALRQLSEAHAGLARGVASGEMTAEQANAAAKRIVEQIKTGTDAVLRASPFAAMLDAGTGRLFTDPAPKEPRGSRETINLEFADQLEQQALDADLKGDKTRAATLRENAANLRKATFNAQTTTEDLSVLNVPDVAQKTYSTLLEEKAKHTVELSQGDQHYGMTQIVPRQSTSRTNRVAEIEKSLAALEKSYPDLRKLRPKSEGEAGPPAKGPAAPPMSLAPAGTNDAVRVQSPDGRTGTIPRAQLPDAIKAGFKQIQ